MLAQKQTAADSAKSPISASEGMEAGEEDEERKKSVLKSGWLWQHTNTAKQWQSLWTVVWDSGRMMFWKGEDEVDLIDHLYLPMDKPVDVLASDKLSDDLPPGGLPRENLFGIYVYYINQTYYFCAKNRSDKDDWVAAITRGAKIVPTAYWRFDDGYWNSGAGDGTYRTQSTASTYQVGYHPPPYPQYQMTYYAGYPHSPTRAPSVAYSGSGGSTHGSYYYGRRDRKGSLASFGSRKSGTRDKLRACVIS